MKEDTDELLGRKSINIKEHKRIVEQLSEEIVRKDSQIKALRERNDILINTTVKQAAKITDLLERIKLFNKKSTN